MRLLLTLFLILFFGKSNVDAQATAPIVAMQRTACYGTCPVYHFQVYEDGQSTFKGEAHHAMIGSYEAQLTSSQMEWLVQLFLEPDFFNYQDRYYKAYSDWPTTYVTFNQGGRSKKVMDYYDAPESLKELENQLDSLIGELKWTNLK